MCRKFVYKNSKEIVHSLPWFIFASEFEHVHIYINLLYFMFPPKKMSSYTLLTTHLPPQDKHKSPSPTTHVICRHLHGLSQTHPLSNWAALAPTFWAWKWTMGSPFLVKPDWHIKLTVSHKKKKKKLLFSDIFITFSMTRGVHLLDIMHW